jgi:hypothetical protein
MPGFKFLPGHLIIIETRHRLTNLASKMLYLVGLGLADETDISVKGLQIVKQADRVYLEAYTSVLLVDKEKLVRSCSSLSTRYE